MAPVERILLSPWTGEFLDPGQEAAFQADNWPRFCRQLRLMAGLAAAVFVAALYINWQGFGAGVAFRTMIALRVGTGLSLAAIAIASRPSWPQRRVHWLIIVTILFLVVTRVTQNLLGAPPVPPGSGHPALALPVMPLMIFAVIAIPGWMAVLWSGVGSLLFARDQVAQGGFLAPATQVMLLNLLLANGAGYAFRVAWNRVSRRDYALRGELEREVLVRQRAEQEARQADSAKGRFLAAMSHEIRTPLNGLLGGVQLLQETPLQDGQGQLLDLLARSGNQLATLLDDILDLARIEAGCLDLTREPFSPLELLADVRAVVFAQARSKGLAFRVEHPVPLPPSLEGDALRLRQVLINLAGNAVKFTAAGAVTVALEASALDGAARFRCRFSVRDTGPGLDAEARARIFAPFERLHRREAGAGLGLAISRELVDAMGGELVVDSVPGQGSTFRFTLELPAGAALLPAAPPLPSRPLAILVVDDQEANRIVAEGLLASLGHRVRSVPGGASALAALRAETFDAVLLDLHLEEMDGLALLGHIRALPEPMSQVPVFLATADAERSHLQACLDAGAQGVLPKPIRKTRLAALLAGVGRVAAPLVDPAQVAQTLADLGPGIWSEGVRACRSSAEASLARLEDPACAASALHQLAGLAANYAMPALLSQVRRAEALLTDSAPIPLEELRALAAASLGALEASSRAPAADPAPCP